MDPVSREAPDAGGVRRFVAKTPRFPGSKPRAWKWGSDVLSTVPNTPARSKSGGGSMEGENERLRQAKSEEHLNSSPLGRFGD
jgi:hypothetical protein